MTRKGLTCVIIVTIVIAMVGTGCTTYKHYGYLQNIEEIDLGKYSDKYEAVIKKDDRLSIVVYGPDSKVVMPYNLSIGYDVNGGNIAGQGRNGNSYLVDKYGTITFPILGELHVEGMTRRELEKYLTERIAEDVKNPTVIVNFLNYTINFLGAVNRSIVMDNERISIFDALAKAGDMNLNARRDNVLLIREVDGKPTYHRIDLRKAELLSDEYYWLQQNDIVYIQPGPVEDTTRTISFWTSVIGAVTTITTMVLLLVK
ncbi:MAG: polysaccharide biosynthesis/export family protein [Bacteroidaceae bacterium]|nr:polysaccharide biosynthesis/export family protein [Bacteroidaceae bacterium]